MVLRHTYSRQSGNECPICGGACLHSVYSKRYVRFVQAHHEAYEAAYLDGNPQTARNELERLEREFRTLPPRHECSCYGHHCMECAKIQRNRVDAPTRVEIGRTHMVNPPTPMVTMLDIAGGYV